VREKFKSRKKTTREEEKRKKILPHRGRKKLQTSIKTVQHMPLMGAVKPITGKNYGKKRKNTQTKGLYAKKRQRGKENRTRKTGLVL